MDTVLYTPAPAAKPYLIVLSAKEPARVYRLGELTTIGRATGESRPDVAPDSRIVSRRHGEIRRTAEGYRYIDRESANGTWINGRFYRGGLTGVASQKLLRDGDTLCVTADGERRESDAVVMIFSESEPGELSWGRLELGGLEGEIGVGRRPDASARLSDAAVSRNHASFFKTPVGWAVTDHGSTNGVFLNNARLVRPAYLKQLDCVRIASSYFIFWGDALLYSDAPAKRPVSDAASGGELVISIAERSVWQRFKKQTLLRDISLSVSAGEMVLILGGSGAGKTTFMNAVMGYEKAEGRVLHKGVDIYEDYDRMKYEIGFVPQQDLLRGSDTVYATLKNAAELKLPKRTTPERLEERIGEVLELMGLTRESASLVSKLSGGQRKRLSIAVELIADPGLFFLDEPDSGLDGVMARSLMDSLRAIADGGRIVMVITHSPDRVAYDFDKVIVLAKSVADNCGRMAFFGPVAEALEFFETDSLEGVVRRINREDEGGDGLSDHYIAKYQAITG